MGIIQSSLRMPTSPFLRRYPSNARLLTESQPSFICSLGLYVYSRLSARLVAKLWECTHSPALINFVACPIGKPYFITSSPSAISQRATLWPRCATESPSTSTTPTLSFGWICINRFISNIFARRFPFRHVWWTQETLPPYS